MKLIFTSYVSSPGYDRPQTWLKRIEAYTGILESLATSHVVIGIERINYEGDYEQNGVHYYFTRLKNPVVHFPFRMHRLINKLQPDVVFVNGFIFPLQIIQLRMKLTRHVKIIILHRAERPFRGIKKWVQKIADKSVDAYFFTSTEFGDEWIKEGIIRDPKKIHEIIQASSVFHPGDRSIARSALNISGSPVFLWVGRLDENKDPITVMQAFIQFLEKWPAARLYMIYHEEKLFEEITQLIAASEKAKESIKLVGKVLHDELQQWYNSADFFISGSHYEGGGTAASEAMSCGCIPILTNIISFRKMTGPGKCGLLYGAGNKNELLAVLLKAMDLDQEKERIKVLHQFKEELSFEAIAKKMNKVIASSS
jgi:glycosyltransferase involved in cell wall biosynthesis